MSQVSFFVKGRRKREGGEPESYCKSLGYIQDAKSYNDVAIFVLTGENLDQNASC